MTWNELTVWQYQQIYPIVTKPEKDWTTLDVESKLVGILHNLTDTQVDSLSVAEFNKLKVTLNFLDDKIEGKPVKYTEVNGKRYKFIYDGVDDKYDASKHSQYAEDLQGANFMHVYQSVVFFYQVYRNWIEVSKDYLVQEMMNQGMTMDLALKGVQILCSTLDGSIAPNLLPTTKISQLTKATS